MAAGDRSSAVRALAFIGLATACGSAALLGLVRLVTTYQLEIEEAQRPEDSVMAIVAARDLFQGISIAEEDLYAVQIPPRYLPDGVFLTPEHVVGRIPRERILANEMIRAQRLADPESGAGLHAVIPRGMRAISVEIDDGAALSGFLEPGSYVDLLVTLEPEGGKADAVPETKTILQAVFVLGVNSRLGSEGAEEAQALRGRQAPSVTLLVTAEQAEEVAHAEQLGDVVLTLRHPDDVAQAAVTGATVDALRTQLRPDVPIRVVAPPEAPERACSPMRVIGGPEVEVQFFDDVTGERCDR